jgi:hypothetical protein
MDFVSEHVSVPVLIVIFMFLFMFLFHAVHAAWTPEIDRQHGN